MLPRHSNGLRFNNSPSVYQQSDESETNIYHYNKPKSKIPFVDKYFSQYSPGLVRTPVLKYQDSVHQLLKH